MMRFLDTHRALLLLAWQSFGTGTASLLLQALAHSCKLSCTTGSQRVPAGPILLS